jgi:hypothetical protein
MTINVYDIGDNVKMTGAFTDSNDDPADPSGVQLAYEDPSGNVTTLVYGVDAAVVKNSTGSYYVELEVDEAGDWHYRWIATGTGKGAQIGQFAVKPQQVLA